MQHLKKHKFEILQMQPQNTNSVIVSADDKCIIFDPWGRFDDWLTVLQERNLTPVAIYATHGHPDHISAAPALAYHFDIPWYLHSGDFRLVGWGNELLEYYGLPAISLNDNRPNALDIKSTEVLPNLYMDIIETPGHTPGGVAYHFPDEQVIIIGDTIFQDNIGRYDLPGGDAKMLFQSISNIYNMNLPNQTSVIHGHGMDTNIGWLHQNNPYFKSGKKP